MVSLPLEITLRVAFAFIASLLFGLERQFKKKPVGFGAFTFVTVGSTVLTIVSLELNENPLPLLGAIMTGIGFLGAGAIIKGFGDRKVVGITTAAAIWVFAALGITLGAGEYGLAAMIGILIAIIVLMDHYFEEHGFGSHSKHVTVTVTDASKVKEIDKFLPVKHKVLTYSFDTQKNEYIFSFLLSGTKTQVNTTLNMLVKHPAVSKITVE